MTVFKVLLVEDHSDWQNILEEKLRRAMRDIGHTNDIIQLVKTFDDAYIALRENPWHLLVTDIGLGSASVSSQRLGEQLIDLARDLRIPAIAVSGTDPLTTKNVRDLLIEHGASDFFSKRDFDGKEFITKVQELLRMSDKPSTKACALLIGIADYQHIHPLSKTTNDAKDLYDALIQNGYSSENITLLIDHQATKVGISEKLDWLARHTQPEDTAIIFFSGHGAQFVGGFSPGEYLCPVEAAIAYVTETCISDAEFTNALRAIRAGRLVVFLDACHAGGVGEPKNLNIHIKSGLSEAAYSYLEGKGRAIIASCKPDEVSWELPDMRNGLFTHYLLKGINGEVAQPDGSVWLTDLFGYVSQQLPKHKPQHPFLKSATENFIIARVMQTETIFQSSLPVSGFGVLSKNQLHLSKRETAKLRKIMYEAYDRSSFEILCIDLGLDYHDLRGETLEQKKAYLIDRFQRNHCYEELVRKVLEDHPHLTTEMR